MHDLELSLVNGREESIALEVLGDPGDVESLAAAHLHRFLVGSLATDDEDLCNVAAAAEGLEGFLQGARHGDRFGVGGRLGGLREHDIHAAGQGSELLGDGLPRLSAHDDGVLGAGWGCHCDSLEEGHVTRELPGQGAIFADASVRGGGDDHGEGLGLRLRCLSLSAVVLHLAAVVGAVAVFCCLCCCCCCLAAVRRLAALALKTSRAECGVVELPRSA
mmetsp:Transcript_42246/g.90751  ORF Transcript_42246/g.90751 Transcript_42246/m.90751 type:complete len:219 (-) Transcript_42246:41-697(-)